MALNLAFAISPKIVYVPTDGGTVKAYVFERKGAPTAITANGASIAGPAWFRMLEKIHEQGYQGVAFDFDNGSSFADTRNAPESSPDSVRLHIIPRYVEQLRGVLNYFGRSIIISHSMGSFITSKLAAGFVASKDFSTLEYDPQEEMRLANELLLASFLHGTSTGVSPEMARLSKPGIQLNNVMKSTLGRSLTIPLSWTQRHTIPGETYFSSVPSALVGRILGFIGTENLPHSLAGVNLENFSRTFRGERGRDALKALTQGGFADLPGDVIADIHKLSSIDHLAQSEIYPKSPVIIGNGTNDGAIDLEAANQRVERNIESGNGKILSISYNGLGHIAVPFAPEVIEWNMNFYRLFLDDSPERDEFQLLKDHLGTQKVVMEPFNGEMSSDGRIIAASSVEVSKLVNSIRVKRCALVVERGN